MRLSAEVLEQRARTLAQSARLEAGTVSSMHESYLLFSAGGETFAVRLESISEIVAAPSVTAIPGSPESIAGVVNLRGAILDVVDLDVLLALGPPDGPRAGSHLLVCDVEGERFSLRVESVRGIAQLPPECIDPVQTAAVQSIAGFLAGIARFGPDGGEVVSILDVARVLASDRLQAGRSPESARPA